MASGIIERNLTEYEFKVRNTVSITDANQAMNGTDLYRVLVVGEGVSNLPANGIGMLFHIGVSQNNGAQFLVYLGGKTIYRRSLNSGTWSNWETL